MFDAELPNYNKYNSLEIIINYCRFLSYFEIDTKIINED